MRTHAERGISRHFSMENQASVQIDSTDRCYSLVVVWQAIDKYTQSNSYWQIVLAKVLRALGVTEQMFVTLYSSPLHVYLYVRFDCWFHSQ